MKSILLKESFIQQISEKDLKAFLATLRIFSVISMKCKVITDIFSLRRLNNGEFVDLYCDLFATFHEGAKKYFQIYCDTIQKISGVAEDSYTERMKDIFDTKNRGKNATYKVLEFIRNNFSFHFSIENIEYFIRTPIATMNPEGHVTFISMTPNLFKYITEVQGNSMTENRVKIFFSEVYNEEVRPFIEYLERIIHSITDKNAEIF